MNESIGGDDANTPLPDEEADALIPTHIATRAELNQWEAVNIARAQAWASARRRLNVLSTDTLRELHRRMFDRTWQWAGTFRRADVNISPYPSATVPVRMHELVGNARAQYEASRKGNAELDEIAMRFHYELVRIHPWPNGNGRHARLAADLLLERWGRPAFTWGSAADLAAAGAARPAYIAALRRADGGDFTLLREFVRS